MISGALPAPSATQASNSRICLGCCLEYNGHRDGLVVLISNNQDLGSSLSLHSLPLPPQPTGQLDRADFTHVGRRNV